MELKYDFKTDKSLHSVFTTDRTKEGFTKYDVSIMYKKKYEILNWGGVIKKKNATCSDVIKRITKDANEEYERFKKR